MFNFCFLGKVFLLNNFCKKKKKKLCNGIFDHDLENTIIYTINIAPHTYILYILTLLFVQFSSTKNTP